MDNSTLYTIATGRSRKDLQWEMKSVSWEQLRTRLSQVTRTKETLAQWAQTSKNARTEIKDVGGFVGGALWAVNERRTKQNLVSRSLLTVDIEASRSDGRQPSLEGVETALKGWAYVVHSTHSYTPERPRFRAVLPLSREVTPDEYTPICLRVCERIGLDIVDLTTDQAARLMFWPSCSADAQFIIATGDGEPVDADALLGTYIDWRNASEWPGADLAVRAAQLRRRVRSGTGGRHMEDPAGKRNIVGAFCSVYDIEGAIAAFGLPYRRAGYNRWTYTGGTTFGGAVVYDGCWLYSFHAHRPRGRRRHLLRKSRKRRRG